MVMRRMKVDATVHGFRSSFRTWASEVANVEFEVAEACLSHRIGSGVSRLQPNENDSPRGRAETEPKTLILGAVDKKRDEGLSYADGKTLCVFLNADVGNRRWPANDVARGLPICCISRLSGSSNG